MIEKKCAKPNCQNQPLRKIEIESSLTIEKYYCPKCGHVYHVPTKVGKTVQVAPLSLVSLGLIKIVADVLHGHHTNDI